MCRSVVETSTLDAIPLTGGGAVQFGTCCCCCRCRCIGLAVVVRRRRLCGSHRRRCLLWPAHCDRRNSVDARRSAMQRRGVGDVPCLSATFTRTRRRRRRRRSKHRVRRHGSDDVHVHHSPRVPEGDRHDAQIQFTSCAKMDEQIKMPIALLSGDGPLQNIGKMQKWVTDNSATLSDHTAALCSVSRSIQQLRRVHVNRKFCRVAPSFVRFGLHE